MKSNNKKSIIILLVLSLINISLYGCTNKVHKQSASAFVLDTFVDISVYTDEDASDLLNECINLCNHYDSMLSISNPESDIYKVNHGDGDVVKVNPETIYLLERELYYAELSGGCLNPAIQSIYELWGFHDDIHAIPEQSKIIEKLETVNTDYIEILPENNEIKLINGAQINLGAVAKGYIADKIKEHLISKGISSAIINLGGNIQTIGMKPDGSKFHVGIQKPFDQTGSSITDVEVESKTVVTSGVYQRYFEVDGINYHHILDSTTGYPVDTDLVSATIIEDSSLEADALSTICIMLGSDKSREFLKQFPNVSAILIDGNNNIIRIN